MKVTTYKIIDAHTHIFPEKIADKAVGSIGDFYGLDMYHSGTCEMLIKSGEKIGVSRYLVCSTATTPNQVQVINDFVAAACKTYPQFFGLGTAFPGMENEREELLRIKELGLHGVKLHSDFQQFNLDDEKAISLYQHCAELSLPILFHTGDDRYDFSAPERLARALDKVPDLRCIAAHFGGYQRWREAANVLLDYPNLRFDTSSTLWKLDPAVAAGLIDHFGADKFFFGTDYPMWDHEEELARFLALPLSEEKRERILSRNFKEFFSLMEDEK